VTPALVQPNNQMTGAASYRKLSMKNCKYFMVKQARTKSLYDLSEDKIDFAKKRHQLSLQTICIGG